MLPFCFLFIFGVFEYGRYLMYLQIVNNAAREGARYAVTHLDPVVISNVTYGNADSDVTNTVNQYLAGLSLNSQQTQVYLSDTTGNNLGTWQNAQAGNSICVKITGNYQLMVSRLLYAATKFPITGEAVMRVENN